MDRARKNIYLTTSQNKKEEGRVYNGDDPDEARAFWAMMKKDEKKREEGNKLFVETLTCDLEELHGMYVNEMKIKGDAVRIRELINSRLYVLEETREEGEFTDKWDRAIRKAKFILEQIDRKFNYLPDSLYQNPSSLMFDIDIESLKELFDKWKWGEVKYINSNTDFDYFAYAIKGRPIPAEKQPYKPMELIATKEALYRELKDLQNRYDKKRKNQKTLYRGYKINAGCLFELNGEPIGELSNPK